MKRAGYKHTSVTIEPGFTFYACENSFLTNECHQYRECIRPLSPFWRSFESAFCRVVFFSRQAKVTLGRPTISIPKTVIDWSGIHGWLTNLSMVTNAPIRCQNQGRIWPHALQFFGQFIFLMAFVATQFFDTVSSLYFYPISYILQSKSDHS